MMDSAAYGAGASMDASAVTVDDLESQKVYRNPHDRPVHMLSVDLLKTYKHINEVYYAAKRKRQASTTAAAPDAKKEKKPLFNDGYDDEDGNYVVQIGEELEKRYIVQELLGKGSFGIVVRAHDTFRNEGVAVKIIKNRQQFYQQAQIETAILRKLNDSDKEDKYNIVRLKKSFVWRSHLCIVFELLSHNLYELLKRSRFRGISLGLIRKFATQILFSLDFLSQPHVQVIHCDLKPENILLRNPKKSAIKVADFGSSCFVNNKMYKYIQSRFYRSPEVIMGLPYGVAIDMWSFACILVEMHTGQPLFDGRDEPEQMSKICELLGTPPREMCEKSPKSKKFFAFDGLSWHVKKPSASGSSEGLVTPPCTRTLNSVLGAETGGPRGSRSQEPGHSLTDYLKFIDLIKRMLTYDPDERISPQTALNHAFFRSSSEVATMTADTHFLRALPPELASAAAAGALPAPPSSSSSTQQQQVTSAATSLVPTTISGAYGTTIATQTLQPSTSPMVATSKQPMFTFAGV